MACGKRTQIKNLLVKAQSGNTFEAPSVSDNYRLDAGMIAQATPQEIVRDIIKSSFTPEASLAGIKVSTVTGVSEMYGADYSDGTTKPWFNDLLNAGQLMETKVYSIPVSAIGTNFVYDEVVTGGTSGSVGRVVVPTLSTDTSIYIVLTSGTFQAEALTGSISGDATATGAEVDAGWSYKFDSSQCVRLSVQAEQDGLISQMYNSSPTFSFVSEAGGIPKINYEIAGAIVKDVTGYYWRRDGSMTDLSGYRSEVVPPIFVGARLSIDDYVPVVDSTLTVDPQITRKLRIDANNEVGAEGYILTDRNPIMSYRIATPTEADLPLFTDWFESKSIKTGFKFDGGEYNTFWFFAPTAKYQNITDADDEGEMNKIQRACYANSNL
jgi:hypothetical protein